MKITILINELNVRGGTHKQMHRLVEYLEKNDHHVTIITKEYDPLLCYPGIDKFKIISFDNYFKGYTKKGLISKLYNKLIGSYKIAKAAIVDADCINIHDNGFGLVSYLIRLRRKKIPIFWQINDLPPVFSLGNSQGDHKNWTYGFRKDFYRRMAQSVNLITVNVSKNAVRVQENLHKSAEVLYCGVDLRYDKLPVKNSAMTKIKLLSTGVFLAYRNYETFLEVHDILSQKGFNVESTIIGSTALNPAYANKIKSIIEKKKLKSRITGDIQESELIDIYNNSDYFLFLNIDQSWGLAVFEAMNFGLPVFVSQSVGAVELLNDNVDSFIVDPLDPIAIATKIEEMHSNIEVVKNITRKAFESTMQMTWDKMYSAKLEDLMMAEMSKIDL